MNHMANDNKNNITVSFVSLGCFKNLVDTEVLGGLLQQRGIKIVSSYETADWLIINTCGFIRDAKEESIDEVLQALEKKEKGEVKKVAVFGCLTQRYLEDLKKSFQGVDILWGVNDLEELADRILRNDTGPYPNSAPFLYNHEHKRILTTTPNSTFIKISEGCNMPCSFCAIPQIRGSYRSRSIASIVAEAERYRKAGFQELNLVSQNSTYYGKDRSPQSELPELLQALSKLGFTWVRVLYLMPEEVTPEIVEAFAAPTVLPYFDLPFQHVAVEVLKNMHRGGNRQKNLALLESIRNRFPEAVIRSTFITGFPAERVIDFQELLDFAAESRIERIGVFAYSDEENTPAFQLKGKLKPSTIEQRVRRLMDVSDQNLEAFNRKLVGSVVDFLPQGPWNRNTTIGRIAVQAPEVDGFTIIETPFQDDYSMYPIRITRFENAILFGVRA